MEADDVREAWEANAAAWTRHSRAGYDVYRDALNTPAFLAALPTVRGLRGLDIGCGQGSNTRQLARLGASMRAVDIAPTFIRHAQEAEQVEPLGIVYDLADATSLPFENETFDFATAFMSLMDMPDQGAALREAQRVLRPGAFLQFSILQWVEMITSAGLAIEQFVEPCASLELADREPVVADTRIAPMSLIARVKRPI